jgi:CMP/dCMP kinase
MSEITIAIDGYSSCGKSTLAKALAAKLGYTFIDSGAMYRGITLFALQQGIIDQQGAIDKEKLLQGLESIQLTFQSVPNSPARHLFLNGVDVEHEIRAMEVAAHVSGIASIKEVRKKLVALQRELGRHGGVVMDGRDIGSVVFPNAELKIFVTASPEVRAQRRYLELTGKGEHVTLDDVANNLKERDFLDTTRTESPLIQTPDALVLDNTNLTREQQLDLVLSWVRERA